MKNYKLNLDKILEEGYIHVGYSGDYRLYQKEHKFIIYDAVNDEIFMKYEQRRLKEDGLQKFT